MQKRNRPMCNLSLGSTCMFTRERCEFLEQALFLRNAFIDKCSCLAPDWSSPNLFSLLGNSCSVPLLSLKNGREQNGRTRESRQRRQRNVCLGGQSRFLLSHRSTTGEKVDVAAGLVSIFSPCISIHLYKMRVWLFWYARLRLIIS